MIDPDTPRRGRDEGGFILPTFALVLIVLIAMAGFGIDVWNWWYTGQQAQRAADAAALSVSSSSPTTSAPPRPPPRRRRPRTASPPASP